MMVWDDRCRDDPHDDQRQPERRCTRPVPAPVHQKPWVDDGMPAAKLPRFDVRTGAQNAVIAGQIQPTHMSAKDVLGFNDEVTILTLAVTFPSIVFVNDLRKIGVEIDVIPSGRRTSTYVEGELSWRTTSYTNMSSGSALACRRLLVQRTAGDPGRPDRW